MIVHLFLWCSKALLWLVYFVDRQIEKRDTVIRNKKQSSSTHCHCIWYHHIHLLLDSAFNTNVHCSVSIFLCFCLCCRSHYLCCCSYAFSMLLLFWFFMTMRWICFDIGLFIVLQHHFLLYLPLLVSFIFIDTEMFRHNRSLLALDILTVWQL